jgi:hypothetical protein
LLSQFLKIGSAETLAQPGGQSFRRIVFILMGRKIPSELLEGELRQKALH